MTLVKDDAAPYVKAFQAWGGTAGQPEWLVEERRAYLDRFAELGFPTRKQEAWRFTNLRPLTAAPLLPGKAAPATVDVAPWKLDVPSHRIVLVDGKFAPRLSDTGALPAGVLLCNAAATFVEDAAPELALFDAADLAGNLPLAALNGAFFTDGFALMIGADVVVDEPIEIIHLTSAAAPPSRHLRNAIFASPGAQATIVETAAGTGAGWTNSVTTVSIGGGAVLKYARLQAESSGAVHTALLRATLGAKARFETFLLTTGAAMSRQDIHVELAGEGAKVGIHGAYLLRGDQEATIAPFVEHSKPGCETNEVLKGVLQDRAHGVFLGTIAVRPGADGTNARQLNRNLLMSPTAAVDTKPELEILADDVKCSHGATVGRLDEAALFYLMARGIDEATARDMLVEAFCADVIDAAGLDDVIADHLHRHLHSWLGGAA